MGRCTDRLHNFLSSRATLSTLQCPSKLKPIYGKQHGCCCKRFVPNADHAGLAQNVSRILAHRLDARTQNNMHTVRVGPGATKPALPRRRSPANGPYGQLRSGIWTRNCAAGLFASLLRVGLFPSPSRPLPFSESAPSLLASHFPLPHSLRTSPPPPPPDPLRRRMPIEARSGRSTATGRGRREA